MGAAAIQLLRLALPTAIILTTSSTQHHEHLVSLGARNCFPRSAQASPSDIKSATPTGKGVHAIIDCVTAAAEHPSIFEALDPEGPKIYSQVMTGVEIQVPDGVKAELAFGKNALVGETGHTVMAALNVLLETGKYKVPIPVEVLGHGFEVIPPGLDLLMKGVSGLKYAVTVVDSYNSSDRLIG